MLAKRLVLVSLVVCGLSWLFTASIIYANYDMKTIAMVQQKLDELGYNPGSVDGKMGNKTRNAIKDLQREWRLSATGEINNEILVVLGIDEIQSFSGLYGILIGDKWGYINYNGRVVIPPQFDDLEWSNMWPKVGELKGKGCLISPAGQVTCPPNVKRIQDIFSGGVALAWDSNEKVGYIDLTGQIVIPFQFYSAHNFHQGLAGVQLKKDGKWGFIDRTGQMVIPPQFDSVNYYGFRKGLVNVEINKKWGFIDRTGQMVIPAQFEQIKSGRFRDGLEAVKINGKWGCINSKGEFIIPAKFEEMWSFEDGFAPAKINGKWGLINSKGELVIPAKYEGILSPVEGFVGVEVNGKWAVSDFSGGFVTPAQFDDIDNFCLSCKTSGIYSRAELNGKWGYVDYTGKIIVPAQFNRVHPQFNYGLAGVEINGKWGYINDKGQTVIPPLFEEAKYFNEGLAMVTLDGKKGYIDLTGRIVAYPKNLCGTDGLVNGAGEILWPLNAGLSCLDSQISSAKAASESQYDPCGHVYTGKVFRARGGVFSIEYDYEVVGFSSSTGKATITLRSDRDFRQEIYCSQIPE